MKTLALLLPPDLQEDGRLLPAFSDMLGHLVRELGEQYQITVILRALRDKPYEQIPANVGIIQDTSTGADMSQMAAVTYVQRGLDAWRDAPIVNGHWDCVIALDGFSPWCLMTALFRVCAERKLVYLQKEPRLYLAERDISAFRQVYSSFDGVLCASRWVQENFGSMFPGIRSLIAHPAQDAAYCQKAAQAVLSDQMEPDCLHIVTVEPLVAWHHAERIPALVEAVKSAVPNLRWHIWGEGPRQPYLLHDIVLRDVWQQVLPEGVSNTMYAMIGQSDGLVHFDDENDGAAAAAQALGIPVLSLRESEGPDELSAWLKQIKRANLPRRGSYTWADRNAWINEIEGGTNNED